MQNFEVLTEDVIYMGLQSIFSSLLSKRNIFMQLFPNQIKHYGPTCRRCLSLFHFSIYSLCFVTPSNTCKYCYKVVFLFQSFFVITVYPCLFVFILYQLKCPALPVELSRLASYSDIDLCSVRPTICAFKIKL